MRRSTPDAPETAAARTIAVMSSVDFRNVPASIFSGALMSFIEKSMNFWNCLRCVRQLRDREVAEHRHLADDILRRQRVFNRCLRALSGSSGCP